MAKEVLTNRLCNILGCKYPIIQTGMGFITPPNLVAAVCNAGAFGIMGAATWEVEETRKKIRQLKELTDKPFGVNFLAYHPRVEEILDLLIEEKVKVASYTRPISSVIAERTKPHGMINIASVGSVKHGSKVQSWGADAVIAQGGEGGGHTGYVGTMVLIPEMVDSLEIPVIAAGGFCDGRGLVAALAMGSGGMAMGTRFLLVKESPVPDHIKQIYLNAASNGTMVTNAVDGLPERVLRNKLAEKLESQGTGFPVIRGIRGLFQMRELFKDMSLWELMVAGWKRKQAYEVSMSQAVLASTFPKWLYKATVEGKQDEGVMPSGQVAGIIDDVPTCKELIDRIVYQAEEVLDRFGTELGSLEK